LVSLVDLAVASVVVAGMLVYYDIDMTGAVFALPLVVTVHVMFTAAMALLLAMGNLFYRDVKYLFEIILTVWMFGTSVVYPVDRIDGTLGTLLALNPMTQIVDAYRWVLLRGDLPPAVPFFGATLASAALFVGAWLVFHRAEFRFAENI
jgi:ABC-type polysaccharide/polyol phosphate export permease